MSEHACPWLDAAECAGLRLSFFRANEQVREPLRILHMRLSMMCRAQFSTERSYQRFVGVGSQPAGLEGTLKQYLEAHSFVVSAKLAWDTLSEIRLALVTLKPPREFNEAIKSAFARHAGARAELSNARSHIEPIAAQIRGEEGDGEGGSAEIFQRAMGRPEGTSLRFGGECFDLARQAAALADVRDTLAPSIAALITPSLSPAAATRASG
jgi:hypothetical protein